MSGTGMSFGAAALGGLASFLSPCVLPLVPAYLCYIAGASLEELTAEDGAPRALSYRALTTALLFVLGFSTVFVALGASASALSRLLIGHLDILGRVAGIVIIVLGLHFTGLFRLRFLDREARFNPETGGGSLVGAYVVGLAFAFGWTPCIGPILGTILALAAAKDTLPYGAALLATYSLGLGVPFLLAAWGLRGFLKFATRFRRHLHAMEVATGALLVATGVLILFGSLQSLSYLLLDVFPGLGRLG
jgi:cytochrome c-type biogenesis protein